MTVIPDGKLFANEICENLINDGYTDFIAGGALGFDTIGAKCVLDLKEKYKNIRLTLALPCKNQCKGWKKSDVDIYEEDNQQYISDTYLYFIDLDVNALTLQTEEVKQVKFEKMSVIKKMMEEGNFFIYEYLDKLEKAKLE